MLVLARRAGQKIYLLDGDDVVTVITVVRTRGNQVSLGVESPRTLTIVREELMTAEQRASVAEFEIGGEG